MMLFRRSWEVTIGLGRPDQQVLDVSKLDLEFKVLKTIKEDPNKCSLVIWNMNQDHRGQLLLRNNPTTGKIIAGIPVSIKAGYVGGSTVIFSGDMLTAISSRQDVDWKTTILASDGGRAYREAQVSASFAKNTPIGSILGQLADAMGVGLGNAADFEARAEIAGIGSKINGPMTFDGDAAGAMTRLMRSIQYVWSIQNGALQIQRIGRPVESQVNGNRPASIVISPSTGLIGEPEASIDASISLGNAANQKQGVSKTTPKVVAPRAPGVIKCKAMMIPGLVPGGTIDLHSNNFNGTYMVTEIEYVGQTFANDWYANMVCRVF